MRILPGRFSSTANGPSAPGPNEIVPVTRCAWIPLILSIPPRAAITLATSSSTVSSFVCPGAPVTAPLSNTAPANATIQPLCTFIATPLSFPLDAGDERVVACHVSIRHVRRVECKRRIASAVQQNQPARPAPAFRQHLHCFPRRTHPAGLVRNRAAAQQVRRRFRHYNFHDGLAPSRARNSARLRVRVTSAANQRRIAHAPGQFAARSPRRSPRNQPPLAVHRNRSD